jgi:hypothetical protein
MDQDHGQRRVSVREASELLGISEHAVRQRIRRNTLSSGKDTNGKVYVLLGIEDVVSADASSKSSDELSASAPISEMVHMLREQTQLLREQLDEAHAANRENRRIIAALTSRIPEIEPPREARDSDLTPFEQAAKGDTPPGDTGDPRSSAREPWWSRWFGG